MPQLQKFQTAGHDKDAHCDYPGSKSVNAQREQQTPEYLIKDSSKRIMDPNSGWALIELRIKTNWHNDH
jgi:hypothetical protein